MAEPGLLEEVYRLRLEELAQVPELARARRFFLDFDLLTSTVLIDAQTTNAAEFSMFDSSGVETVEILSEETSGTGGQIVLRRADGVATIVLDAEQGATGRITTQLLEITGGADLVESFDTGDLVCEPGSVVIIDSERPGELTLSTRAYDPRVAGIVSGAGGVQAA